MAFSEYLNFTSKWGVSILEFVLKFLKPYCFICEFRIIQYLTEKNKIIIAFEIFGVTDIENISGTKIEFK